ncbi:MAG: alanine dehydrogenase [Cyclobacteriaceae bacterium]|nr:alanine dehydrogenase [Cyclobacteriaceae bacterium]
MEHKPKSGFEHLAKESKLYPQEALLEVKKSKKSLFIGVPKEVRMQEKRVPLTPNSVKLIVNNGHEVWIETGAGNSSNFTDKEYSDAGAKIAYNHKELFSADIILKVEPPTFEEIDMMKTGKTLISALQMGNLDKAYFEKVNSKRISALAYELIEDKVGGMPVVRAMSEIAGSSVMLIAAEYLSNVHNGKGVILGGITGVTPTKVVILGAGTVAEFAARTALGLGVDIQIFDDHLYKLRRIKHALGQQVSTCTFEPSTLSASIKDADVVIGALRAEKGRMRYMVAEDVIAGMKPGSVIVDVSIDQGGCFETSQVTTHQNPVFTKYGVIHYCVPNIASRVARTASTALSNIFTPIMLEISDSGSLEDMIFSHKWFMKGIYAYKGLLANATIGQKTGLKYRDLNLLIAARF